MSDTAKRRGRPPTFDRAAALDQAMRLFWRHGYEGASIAMLTEAMGFTAPTLYAAFGSKEALYREALTRYARSDIQSGRHDGARGSAYQTVEHFLHDAAMRFSRADKPKGCMVATGSLYCGAESPGAAETAASLRAKGVAAFVEELEQAKRDGELPAETDCPALARFYTAVLQGMSVQAIDGADAASLTAIADAALNAWPGRV